MIAILEDLCNDWNAERRNNTTITLLHVARNLKFPNLNTMAIHDAGSSNLQGRSGRALLCKALYEDYSRSKSLWYWLVSLRSNGSIPPRHWDLHSPPAQKENLWTKSSLVARRNGELLPYFQIDFQSRGTKGWDSKRLWPGNPKEDISGVENDWCRLYECFDKRIFTHHIGPRRTEIHTDTHGNAWPGQWVQ